MRPKAIEVTPLDDFILRVEFCEGITKLYDVKQLFSVFEVFNKLKDYNLTVEVKDVKKEKINNNYSISYNIFWPTKESISYDIYQKGYSFTTNDYIYVYTFTSDKPINNDNANYTKTINSFKLLDSPIKSNGFFDSEWKKILFTSITFGVLGAIISLIKKSRKQ